MSKKDKEVTKAEWLEGQPDGQKRAEQIRVSRYPQKLIENNDKAFSPRGELIHGGSICKVVRPNKGSSKKQVVKSKKGSK